MKYRVHVKVVVDKEAGTKLFTTFQTYINYNVLEISENGLHCSKEPLKDVRVN
jgi:hypothetical protein